MGDRVKLHLQLLSFGVTAGLIGGTILGLVAPLFAKFHILSFFGVSLVPVQSADRVFHNAFIGAAWGILFLFPWHKYFGSWSLRAFIIGLIPSFLELFIILPLTHHGIAGIDYGYALPFFIVLFNTAFFSFPAYAWFTATGSDYIGKAKKKSS